MRPIHLSTHDISGGAARAAYRLHRALLSAGADSHMLVNFKNSTDPTVSGPKSCLERRYQILDNLATFVYRQKETELFSPALLPDAVSRRVVAMDSDIIHLHWIAGGFLRVESLRKFKKPVVWTMHDMWPFTGGCHYDEGCGRYTEACGLCPQLKSGKERDLSRRVWERKKRAWDGLDITLVSPSRWLADCARKSSLFRNSRIEVIGYGMDTAIFSPVDKKKAREALGLPLDRWLILFGAVEATRVRRKGFHLLLPALKTLSALGFRDKVELMVFGASTPQNPPDFGLKANYLGKIDDDWKLSALYSAADVFVLPSLQDNLPNTVMESFACATPVAAFAVGGVPDMVEHMVNGFLARPLDSRDLAEGMAWILSDPARALNLGQRAREKAEREYSLRAVAEKHLRLYESVLERAGKRDAVRL